MKTNNHISNIFLSAGKCNAQGELPVQSLLQYLIDAATAHANSINIGYSRLIAMNCAWVLSKVSIEIESYPTINQQFRIVTWIVSTNRFYSERAFSIEAADGTVLGHAMTTWMAINLTERKAANLEKLFPEGLPYTGIRPTMTQSGKMAHISEPDEVSNYIFKYCDIDCNRHVNSTRYMELILNRFSVDYFDTHMISHIDITYHAEAYFGQEVEIWQKTDKNVNSTDFEIKRDGTHLTRIRLKMKERVFSA